MSIGDRLGRLTFVAVAITFILVEGVPMLAAWARKQWQNEAREKGRVEERKAWRAWLIELEAWEERKVEAEKGAGISSSRAQLRPETNKREYLGSHGETGGERMPRPSLSPLPRLLRQPPLVSLGEGPHRAFDAVRRFRR